MKALVGLLMVFVAAGTVSAQPDPDYCVVLPMDNMPVPRLIGLPAEVFEGAADLTVTVANSMGDPMPGVPVEIRLNSLCYGLWICAVNGLSGVTDATGRVRLNGTFGGCCTEISSCLVIAEDVVIREANLVVSPDFEGVQGNGATSSVDFVYFGQNWSRQSVCADYDGNGSCGGSDFVVFGQAWAKDCLPWK